MRVKRRGLKKVEGKENLKTTLLAGREEDDERKGKKVIKLCRD